MEFTIYGAQQVNSGRWYVGSTRLTLESRRTVHYQNAARKDRNSKWNAALRATHPDGWRWIVLGTFQGRDTERYATENMFINRLDAIQSGFNSIAASATDEEADDKKKAYRRKEEVKAAGTARNAKRRAEEPEYRERQNAIKLNYYYRMKQDPVKYRAYLDKVKETVRERKAKSAGNTNGS